jgi:Protein of unknown function (DUF3987)
MNELIPFKNWVVTYPHNKIPLNPFTGKKADVTDAATWGDFATADACCAHNQHLLLGFVLTDSPFSCVDLDTYKTTDRNMIDCHRQIHSWFDTYSELSPHGGVHIWCEGKLGIDGKKMPKQFAEVYCSKHYITVTRQSINGHTTIENRQPQLEEYVNWITHEQRAQITQPNSSPETNSDDEVCIMAANAYNGDLFKKLYLGHWQSLYDTQSEADLALVNIIAFFTDSKEQTARIFHNSALGKRTKAHRLGYLYDAKYGIITKAFDQKLPEVRFGDIEDVIKNKVREEALKAISVPVEAFDTATILQKQTNKLPKFIKDELELEFSDFPIGLTGDIARFIYRDAFRPVKEIAIAGAIALMAGICGRFYNISDMGLNHYIAILAPTGTGKEAASIGIEKIVTVVKQIVPEIEKFMGPQSIASPQALMRHLATDSPCCVSRKAELGLWIKTLCSPKANENKMQLRALLLDLYTRSGWKQIVREEIRADRKNDTPSVIAPAFTLYGDSTPEIFYSALDEDQLDQGLISRFLVMECAPDPACMYNPLHGQNQPDERLIQQITGLCTYALRGQSAELNKSIEMTEEASEYLNTFRVECDTKLLENPHSPEAKVYSRGCERLLRLAGLIAVGVDPHTPLITYPIAVWAKKLILRTMVNVVMKFERGEVGEASLFIQQRQAFIQILRKYWKSGFKDSLLSNYNISREMYDQKLITRNYLSNYVRSFAAFRKSRNMKMDFDNMCIDMVKNGVLIGPIEMGKVKESLRTGHCFYIHDFDLILD